MQFMIAQMLKCSLKLMCACMIDRFLGMAEQARGTASSIERNTIHLAFNAVIVLSVSMYSSMAHTR